MPYTDCKLLWADRPWSPHKQLPITLFQKEYCMRLSLIILLTLIGIPAVYHVYALLQSSTESPSVKHLAIIMDGNRRWAKERNLQTREGHQKGAEVLSWLIQYCLEHKIEMVSVYAFSLENFQRSPEELQALFTIMIEESEKALPELIKHGVKVRFIGDRNLFPGVFIQQ